MAFMRGKFYVWGDGKNINIIHGRDITEETPPIVSLDELVKIHGEEKGLELHRMFETIPDPEELRTGVTSPMQVFLPEEVFWALVVRAYDRLTPEEAEKYRGPTRWEAYRDQGDEDK